MNLQLHDLKQMNVMESITNRMNQSETQGNYFESAFRIILTLFNLTVIMMIIVLPLLTVSEDRALPESLYLINCHIINNER